MICSILAPDPIFYPTRAPSHTTSASPLSFTLSWLPFLLLTRFRVSGRDYHLSQQLHRKWFDLALDQILCGKCPLAAKSISSFNCKKLQSLDQDQLDYEFVNQMYFHIILEAVIRVLCWSTARRRSTASVEFLVRLEGNFTLRLLIGRKRPCRGVVEENCSAEESAKLFDLPN
ncbi:hypothetical protein E3N88_18148 [Mikania micrantha]|uniref:Uncharacterized protein n=1 Tax=Mikania micrantha TaxID=192012 RepID=A0A5N6NTT2_9ASTR|nr:hypothetical protein E3N88_18148 [Mikania micrantha]